MSSADGAAILSIGREVCVVTRGEGSHSLDCSRARDTSPRVECSARVRLSCDCSLGMTQGGRQRTYDWWYYLRHLAPTPFALVPETVVE
jgi:hypothetical protein